jgi:hypothetical protein
MKNSDDQRQTLSLPGVILAIILTALIIAPQSWFSTWWDAEIRAIHALYGNFTFNAVKAILGTTSPQEFFGAFVQQFLTGNQSGPLAGSGLATWLHSRPTIWYCEIWLLLNHLVAALLWLLVFLPALLISLAVGTMQRQMNLERFFYASPFRMRLAIWALNLSFMAMVIAIFMPVSMTPFLLPLSVGVFACFCGLPIGRLQKEL